jgi:8-hydroxy-5-deazaflavin:NADPH oxidoreductase
VTTSEKGRKQQERFAFMKIAIIGNGHVGTKLSVLLHSGGHDVVVGTRHAAPQRSQSQSAHQPLPGQIPIASIHVAASAADVVIFAIPYLAYADVLPPLQTTLNAKVVVDASNPLNTDWSPIHVGPQSSAGEQVALLLPSSQVVKAFNMVFADIMIPEKLRRGDQRATVFVASNFATATATVIQLAGDAGFAPVDAGPLQNARYLESMAHLNISLAVAGKGGTDAAFIYHRPL